MGASVSGCKSLNFYPFLYKNSFQDYYCVKTLESLLVMGYYQSVVASWLLMCSRLAVN